MKTRFRRFVPLLFAAFFTLPAPNQGVQVENLKAEVLLKLLSQNRSIDFSAIDSVRLAIFYDQTDARSRGEAETYRRILVQYQNPPFKGKAMSVSKHSEVRSDSLAWGNLQAALIMPGGEAHLPEILKPCADYRVLSMSTDTALVARGISVAVEIDAQRQPLICFNLSSLAKEGAVYDAEILELARCMTWK
ncbi:MAG: DUF4154 domain-containing protein [Calditrichaceae bacterium]|nr:YfiR/HmsC family protein [Calditrichia bacterium]NUQ42762.1 DUF4154 domain-containing protein [Calditrichaceae bacterium]